MINDEIKIKTKAGISDEKQIFKGYILEIKRSP